MNSVIYNITIDKNSDYAIEYSFFEDDGSTPIDFTGFTASFIVSSVPDYGEDSLFTPDSITIVANVVSISILATTTKEVSVKKAYYNLVLQSITSKNRMVEGIVTLTRSLDDN